MEYCGTTLINRIVVSTNIIFLWIKINVNEKTGITMINSEITGNFMTRIYTENRKYLVKDKK